MKSCQVEFEVRSFLREIRLSLDDGLVLKYEYVDIEKLLETTLPTR